jgi:myo-inositol-1(or 4)-monophosphatase
MSPGKSKVWDYFKEQNRYMSSRILYATCVFCHPTVSDNVLTAEEWSAKTDAERKQFAADSGWLIGKVDRLISHLVGCENADPEARAAGVSLQQGRQEAKSVKVEAKAARVSTGSGPRRESYSVGASPVLGESLATGAAPAVSGLRGKINDKDDILGWLQTAKTLARDAGTRISAMRFPPRGCSTPNLNVTAKSGSTDLVTNADFAAQEAIFQGLATAFPSHRRIGEEDGNTPELTSEATWIVDAIDGTTNYVSGLPDVAVCIALAIKGRVVLGVVYNPFRNEMFHAVSGGGAYLNDNPIAVSSTSSLDAAVVVCEWGYERSPTGIDAMLAGARRLMLANVRGLRQLGSGALDLCYVACGRVDAVFCGLAGEGWKIWDYAAAGIVAEEAGAVMSDINGNPFTLTATSMACAAPALAANFVATVKP